MHGMKSEIVIDHEDWRMLLYCIVSRPSVSFAYKKIPWRGWECHWKPFYDTFRDLYSNRTDSIVSEALNDMQSTRTINNSVFHQYREFGMKKQDRGGYHQRVRWNQRVESPQESTTLRKTRIHQSSCSIRILHVKIVLRQIDANTKILWTNIIHLNRYVRQIRLRKIECSQLRYETTARMHIVAFNIFPMPVHGRFRRCTRKFGRFELQLPSYSQKGMKIVRNPSMSSMKNVLSSLKCTIWYPSCTMRWLISWKRTLSPFHTSSYHARSLM